MSVARLRTHLVTVALWVAAAVGVFAWSGRLRAERGETAVARLRAFPFGVGRHTRLDASLGALQRAHGSARFDATAPPWVFGPVRVEVRFADTPPAVFEIEGDVATPLDDAARALAETLRQTPPAGRLPQ